MRIATYNVWNTGKDIDIRAEQLFREIDSLDADIIGLQEVSSYFWEKLIANVKYKDHLYCSYQNDDEGLAFLCKHPISSHFFLNESAELENSRALNITIEVGGINYSATNVHLPWDSILAKERQIVAVDRHIRSQKDRADFFILLGDFNCGPHSSVQHFLLGEQSLLGHEANPVWNDLTLSHAALNGYEPVPTLDFVNNPRWRGKNSLEIPVVFDRILILNSYNWDYKYTLNDVSVFGRDVSSATGFAPSDHYGVLAEVEFAV